MRAVVTGSSGFIGAALAEELLLGGWEVIGIDNHSNYYSVDLKEVRLESLRKFAKFDFIQIDVSSRDVINSVIEKFAPETVFHLAAQAGVRIPHEQIHKYVDSNLLGFTSVLQACVVNKVPNFLFASSSSVYGDLAKIPYVEGEQNLLPNSFYGATKLANEILAKSIIGDSVTRARGMRFFTVYGPMGRPDMAYFRIISNIVAGSQFELYGDGKTERDFTFVDDCVEMIILLEKELRSKKPGYIDVVNIGGGHPISISKLIELCVLELGKSLDYTIGAANSKDAARTMADPNYLIQLAGSKPNTPFELGLKKTISWALNSATSEQLRKWTESSS